MTEPAGKFTLKNSAEAYPDAGFDPTEDHYVVQLDGLVVGTIYRIADEWVWSIDVGMMGMGSGRASGRREARMAFRAAWDERATRLGPEHVARALAIARGKG